MSVSKVMFVNKVNEMYSWKFSKILKTCTAFEIQVLSTSAIKCQGKFRIFQFALAMRWQKNCWRFNKLLFIMSAMALAYLSILPRTMIQFFNSWYYLFYICYVVYTYNTLKREKQKTVFLPLITLFFLCVFLL